MHPKIGSRHLYSKLGLSCLAEQVLEYIGDRSKKSLARCEALEIARFCELEECKEPALDIFLDPSEEEHVRRTAGYVLLAVGDEETKSRMKPLASGDHPEDVYDQLKGLALKALWPDFISSRELFSIITPPPKHDSFYGTYEEFLHHLPVTLTASDMPEALSWLGKQPSRQSLPYVLRDLMDAIMIRAWDHVYYPVVLSAFAKTCLRRLESDYRLVERFPEGKNWIDIVGDQVKRRRILDRIIQMLCGSANRTTFLVSSQTPLVLNEDLSWLLDHLAQSENEDLQRVLAKLIRLVFYRNDSYQVEPVLTEIQHNEVLADELSRLWRPVALDSLEADEMRAKYAKQSEFEAVRAEQERSEQEAYIRLLRVLEECEAGNPWLFNVVTEELLLRPRPAVDHLLLEADLTSLPGWRRSDDAVRKRIIQAAKRYLVEHRAKPGDWLGTNQYDSGVFAGYKSFRLIFAEEEDHMITIPDEVWGEWAPVILAYPTRFGFGDEETFMQLVSIAFCKVPEAILSTLTFLLEKENREKGTVIVTRKIRYCRGPEVERTLLAKLRDDDFTANSSGVLLDELLARRMPQAKDYAEDLVKSASHLQGTARQTSVIAARLLAFHTRVVGWRTVWTVILTDEDFALSVIPHIAALDRDNNAQILKSLPEEEVGRLFVWLTKHYPHREDPKYDGAHTVETREEIADWRDSILIELRDRATIEALNELHEIQAEFPFLNRLKWIVSEAYEAYRKNSWIPPQPREVLELALDTKKRLVRSERELLETVADSLRSLEKELQGETPAAVFLWDHIKDDQYKPKRETDFSDYIKLHLEKELRDRGVVVNREVQIHRGERTDIYVNALSKSPRDGTYDSITVIIEVKGCWHDQLWQAMETQLVGQYMTNNPCNTGLYVVGWFHCKHWASQDQQTKQLSKGLLAMEILEAQSRLDARANDVSTAGRVIRALVLDTGLHRV